MEIQDLSSVGNHFFLGLQPTTSLHDNDKYLLEALKPAGVILFKSNFMHDMPYDEWLESHRRLIDDVKKAIGREKFFLAIDHEGGRVCRTPHPVTRFISASQWKERSADVARAMGVELASIGMNMSFAPVMDIHTNPDNPVIGDRAFATTPHEVSQYGLEFMDGIQGTGVWACVKHFPGHGDTNEDSHHALPVINLDRKELAEREFVPFKAAVDHDIKMIMTAHIMFPNIDPDQPATLSKKVTQGILRDEFGYEGVVVSDDIGMHAMDAYFKDGDTMKQFLEAGNDMVMICAHFTDTQRVVALAEGLKEATKDAKFRSHYQEPSHDRVAAMLAETKMNPIEKLADQVFEDHRNIVGVYKQKTVEVV